ncbi:MAG: 30S ribosomal protein S4 [Candidatus Pacearchaeota archaeon]
MPKRKTNQYSKPRKLYDSIRIAEENQLKEKYGLKNKREIWKAEAKIKRIRDLAKELITKSDEEKHAFIIRLQKMGLNVSKIAEVLALNKEDWLKRRLQTIVFARGLVRTPKQARQLVVHKHVQVGDRVINIPSYIVALEEEPEVKLNIVLKIKEQKSKIEKIKQEMEEEIQNENNSIELEEMEVSA